MLTCPVRSQALRDPEAIAVHYANKTISYELLDLRITAMVAQLRGQGVAAGEVVACCDENSTAILVIIFACIRIGVAVCPLDYRFTDCEKQQLLNSAGIYFLWQKKPTMMAGIQSLTLDASRAAPRNDESLAEIVVDAECPASIIFTSGSSGTAKAAAHSLYNHYYSALGSQSVIPLLRQDCWLASLPFCHIGGLALVMRCFFAGASIALLDRTDLLASLSAYPITHVSLVPTQLLRLLEGIERHSISLRLQYILLGGAPISQSLLAAASALSVNIYHSYGLTEMSSQVATATAQQSTFSAPLPYRQWQLRDNEIVVRGETLFLGYLIQGELHRPVNDTWFHTNDVAELTMQGLKVVGRRDNMFICGGENCQPEAIEALITHFSSVDKALVVPFADAEFGAIPVAFVQWHQQQATAELCGYLRQRMAGFKVPKHFLAWPSFDGDAMKPNRRQFQEHAQQLLQRERKEQ